MTFSGTVGSDYLKLIKVSEDKKVQLINFAATDFVSIRNSLINYIKSVYPLDYNNFSESDLGMMLIELVSYVGAVNSMKVDMIANERILRTAKQRKSVKDLLELIGVNLKGPTSAAANAKMVLQTASPDPSFPLTITANNRVFGITSPEDGTLINFILYKVVDGLIADLTDSTGDLQVFGNEADSSAGTEFTNLVLLEGTLVTEEGSFSTTESVKTISLAEAPVIEGSIQVFIKDSLGNGEAWRQVNNLYYASGATDQIFQVVYGDNYTAKIIFGDAITGAIPPTNSTYFVIYRVGGGTRGNIKSEVINASVPITTSPFSFTTQGIVENITAATGGNDAESIEHAKKYGPLVFKSQNRLVTLEDYYSYVNTFVSPSGKKAKGIAVTSKAFSSANVIDVYVLEIVSPIQLQKASPQYKRELLEAMEPLQMITDEVVAVDGLIRTLDLIVTIKVDKSLTSKEEEVKTKVRDVVTNFFSIDNFDFGKALIVADLNRAIFDLDDVVWSTVDNIDQVVQVDFNEILQLNNLIINVDFI